MGAIEHATTLEVTQTSEMMTWRGFNAGQAASEITANSCALALDQCAGTASFDFTLVFYEEIVDVVAVLNVLSMKMADT
ncbi:hypothetical protein A8B78_12330 [Jannaschia sp. EhC01]|nr:hypothetical protein A8B78_12330 [Jannaschia sp. EhC01]